MAKGTVSSDEHVDVKLTNGTLTADRLRITDNGDVIRFEGNVVMNLVNLDGGDPASAQAEAAAEPAPAPPRTRRPKTTNAK
jgi:lipopolysaccharide export system protein LptC